MPWSPRVFLRQSSDRFASAASGAAAGVTRAGKAVARATGQAANSIGTFRPFARKSVQPGLEDTGKTQTALDLKRRRPRPGLSDGPSSGTARWIGVFAAALVAFLAIRMVDWIGDIATRSPLLAIAASLAVLAAIGAVCAAVRMELGSVARLKSHIDLHNAFGADDATPLSSEVRTHLQEWMEALPTEHDRELIHLRISEDAPARNIADLIEAEILRAMDRAAVERIRTGVMHAFGLIALSPTPITDTVLFAWRALRLVREIAQIYGLRPTMLGSLWLARQVISDAALIAAADLAADALATVLGDKLAARLSSPLAEGSVAAYRMARFGLLTIERCRPVPFRENDQLGLFSVLGKSSQL